MIFLNNIFCLKIYYNFLIFNIKIIEKTLKITLINFFQIKHVKKTKTTIILSTGVYLKV